MTKTITLTGEETIVKLDRQYPYMMMRNFVFDYDLPAFYS